jgi:GT2 family glycosyltransferase
MEKLVDNPIKIISDKDPVSHPQVDDLTIIIPTLGRPILQRCLQAIATGTKLPACIIVVDQGDNFWVAEWLESLKAKGVNTLHQVSKEKGPAASRNQAIDKVRTPFVAAIDDDCVAEIDWVEKMTIQLHSNPDAIITGRVEPAGDGIAATVVTSRLPRLYRHPSIRFPSPLTTGNMGFSLKTSKIIGNFDTHLFTSEDNDWAYRALRAGISIRYSPDIVVYHNHWRDKSQEIENYDAYAQGLGLFYGKHLRHGDYSMILRTGISIFRGFRDVIQGSLHHDNYRRMNGLSRITHLIPGLFAGLRGMGL